MADNTQLIYPYLLAPTPRNPFNYERIVEGTRDTATAWLSIDLIKQQLNLYGDASQDLYLEQLDLAVRMYVENYLGIALVPRTFITYYSGQNTYTNPLALDIPYDNQTIVTINSVQYWNTAQPSVLTTLAPINYQYDVTSSRIILFSLPSDISASFGNAIVANWSIAESPYNNYPDIQQAGLLLLTHLYNNRSNTVPSRLEEVPMGFKSILQSYKPLVL